MRLRSKAMKIVEKTCYFQMLVASTIIKIISKKKNKLIAILFSNVIRLI